MGVEAKADEPFDAAVAVRIPEGAGAGRQCPGDELEYRPPVGIGDSGLARHCSKPRFTRVVEGTLGC